MAVCFAYAWGAETAVQLVDMGWTLSSTSASYIAPNVTYQYIAPGAPAGHSIGVRRSETLVQPAAFRPASAQGSIQVVVRLSSGEVPQNNYILVRAHDSGTGSAIYLTISSGGALNLYVDNVYKSTSALAYDFQDWVTITLFYDMRATLWIGRAEVNGVESNSAATDSRSAVVSGASVTQVIYGAANSYNLGTNFGMMVVRDTYAESAPVGRYATIIQLDSDVGARTTGTWTPDTGSDSFARINENPLDTANYTEEASPSASDVLTCGFTANLSTKLGFTPGTIDAVACYTYSTGLNNTAKAGVGDGSSVTHGSTETIGSTTTSAGAIAETKPSGGAWAGTDSPEATYTVVSI